MAFCWFGGCTKETIGNWKTQCNFSF